MEKEDDGSGAASISDDHGQRGRHVARAALRQQAALGTAARAGSSAHHQEEQVQTWEERLTVSLTYRYGESFYKNPHNVKKEYKYVVTSSLLSH